jgi:hypothetical protein
VPIGSSLKLLPYPGAQVPSLPHLCQASAFLLHHSSAVKLWALELHSSGFVSRLSVAVLNESVSLSLRLSFCVCEMGCQHTIPGIVLESTK